MKYQAFVYHGHAAVPGWASVCPPSASIELTEAWAQHHVEHLRLFEASTGRWIYTSREVSFVVIAAPDDTSLTWLTPVEMGAAVIAAEWTEIVEPWE